MKKKNEFNRGYICICTSIIGFSLPILWGDKLLGAAYILFIVSIILGFFYGTRKRYAFLSAFAVILSFFFIVIFTLGSSGKSHNEAMRQRFAMRELYNSFMVYAERNDGFFPACDNREELMQKITINGSLLPNKFYYFGKSLTVSDKANVALLFMESPQKRKTMLFSNGELRSFSDDRWEIYKRRPDCPGIIKQLK